jgi:hypothetical protein
MLPVHLRRCRERISGLPVLVKVPAIAVDALKYDKHSVFFLPWLLKEVDAFCLHSIVVSPEVVGLQEQKTPSAALIADKAFLPVVRRAGKKNSTVAVRGRRHHDPALTRLRRVRNEGKAQLSRADAKIVHCRLGR